MDNSVDARIVWQLTEICYTIFNFLDDKTVYRCISHVNRKWRQIAFSRLRVTPRGTVHGDNNLPAGATGVNGIGNSANASALLSNATAAASTYWSTTKIDNSFIKYVAEILKDFKEDAVALSFQNCWKITNDGLQLLEGLSLSALDLKWCYRITKKGIEIISKNFASTLHTLNISYCISTDDNTLLEIANNITGLHTLDVSGCVNITNAGLAHLSKLKHLRTLIVSACSNLTADKLVEHLPNIQALDVSACNLDDAQLLQLTQLRNMRELNLRANWRITDKGIAQLISGRPFVSTSNNSNSSNNKSSDGKSNGGSTEGSGLSRSSSSSNDITTTTSLMLTKLDLSQCRHITDEALRYLKPLHNTLVSLSLRQCSQITDAGVLSLQKLYNLRELDLGYINNITDRGLGILGESLTKLRTLNVSYNQQLTDKCLLDGRLLRVVELDLTGTKISPEAQKQFETMSAYIYE